MFAIADARRTFLLTNVINSECARQCVARIDAAQSTHWQMKEIGVIAHLLLEMIPWLTTTVGKQILLSIKGIVFHALGTMARREGTAEGDNRMIGE